ncbi:hypothetical protein [Novosphingobium sp. BW1]|uniref:hypothetical protein n=1 Tax=Novosphingobium sp. BW1 TaxID=2592621 RepID=UPI0011DEE274|nr:hypothetical protein [Novosphingobium sp. BW1]TYC90664.1 hypothetical protein FMM79_05115 [Novosphingobium sp. BW1]
MLDDEMVKLDTETGVITALYTSPAHTERHLFPDDRYSLKASNRTSDREEKWRGLSSLPARFMLFMFTRIGLDLPSPEKLEDYAPHGAKVGVDPRASAELAGQGGLYIGQWGMQAACFSPTAAR